MKTDSEKETKLPNPIISLGAALVMALIFIGGVLYLLTTFTEVKPREYKLVGDSECYDVPETAQEATLEPGWQPANLVDRQTLLVRRSMGEVEVKSKTEQCYEWYAPRPDQLDYRIIHRKKVWWRELKPVKKSRPAVVTHF